jgi:dihydropteroate synthase
MAFDSDNRIWRCKDITLDLGKRTHIMGVLNITPDSFSDGGRYRQTDKALERALEMEREGADIIDVGGESTRPGSQAVTLEEELHRVIPLIEQLRRQLKIPISIDTYKASVAERAVVAGAAIVNDISGLQFDQNMAHVVAKSGAGIVVMHIKGTPRDMQKNPHYDDLMTEIGNYLEQSKQIALAAGIERQRIVVDPGIGFGKRLQDNFQIIRELLLLAHLKCPILVGPSRKSFIGSVLDLPVEQRLEGTAAAVTACILNGADVVRVHDVKEIKRVALIADKIVGKGNSAQVASL